MKIWIEKYEKLILKDFEVVVAGSNGSILSALKNMPSGTGWFKLIGIFDNDQSEEIKSDDCKWKYMFLPGTSCPEIDLLPFLNEIRHDLENKLYLSSERINLILSSTEGLNYHDRLNEIAELLGCNIELILELLFQKWILKEENIKDCFGKFKLLQGLIENPKF